jgi:hypothetical protein
VSYCRIWYVLIDWELTVDNPILSSFEAMVQRDFPPGSKGPYPTYSLCMVSKCAAKAATSASATPIPEPMLDAKLAAVGAQTTARHADLAAHDTTL